MLVEYLGLTLLHTQNKKQGTVSELNLEMEIFFRFSDQTYELGSEQADRIPFVIPPPCATWGSKSERARWGFSRFWHSRPQREAQTTGYWPSMRVGCKQAITICIISKGMQNILALRWKCKVKLVYYRYTLVRTSMYEKNASVKFAAYIIISSISKLVNHLISSIELKIFHMSMI